MGRTYGEPKLVLFSRAVESACGIADSAIGPFYCPSDHKVYLDLSFFGDLQTRFSASGDFAQAYVIAHEVGHHVQTLLGISDKVRGLQSRTNPVERNKLSVRMELQAHCFAGVWANQAHKSRQILESGDIEEGLKAASAIGDDRIQRQSQGHVVPDAFTHGSFSTTGGMVQAWTGTRRLPGLRYLQHSALRPPSLPLLSPPSSPPPPPIPAVDGVCFLTAKEKGGEEKWLTMK